jgi:hypothetical protein
MRDIATIVEEIIEYCNKEQNYSYLELREYAIKNKLDWSWALSNKNARMAISEYLKGKRKKLKSIGIQQHTLEESLNKLYKQ